MGSKNNGTYVFIPLIGATQNQETRGCQNKTKKKDLSGKVTNLGERIEFVEDVLHNVTDWSEDAFIQEFGTSAEVAKARNSKE